MLGGWRLILAFVLITASLAVLAEREGRVRELKARFGAAKSQLHSITTERDNLNVALRGSQLRIGELESKRAELESRGSELESKRSELESKRSELESKRSELESKQAQLESQIGEMEWKLRELEWKLGEPVASPNGLDSIFDLETIRSVIPAKVMLNREFGSETPFQGRSPEEIAKLLNYVAFNHCKTDPPYTGQNNAGELFETCRTACAGIAYVLRGLLAAHGIKSRYVNLYNLPNQGNHTVVEAEIRPGVWALFDPTFGSFFSASGVDGQPLSLSEVEYSLPSKINSYAYTAVKGGVVTKSLVVVGDLYNRNAFKFPFMRLTNYLSTEVSASVGSSVTAPLVLRLHVGRNIAIAGTMVAKTKEEGLSAFQAWSEKTLRNSDPSDDVSYLFHVLGNYSPYFNSANIIRLSGLREGSEYELQIAGIAEETAQIQLVGIGKDLRLENAHPQSVGIGPYIMERKFRALRKSGEVYVVLNKPRNSFIYLFGVSVAEVSSNLPGQSERGAAALAAEAGARERR